MVAAQPNNYYDAVILDINMPIMDGFEACQLIFNYLNENHQAFALSV
jgi:CheY-like chemotaxis protein